VCYIFVWFMDFLDSCYVVLNFILTNEYNSNYKKSELVYAWFYL